MLTTGPLMYAVSPRWTKTNVLAQDLHLFTRRHRQIRRGSSTAIASELIDSYQSGSS